VNSAGPRRLAVIVLTAMLTLSVSVARAQGLTMPLSADDRSMIDQWLGKGVVGQALPAPTIGDTSRYLVLREGARIYNVHTKEGKVLAVKPP
jgi:hypothetical protein